MKSNQVKPTNNDDICMVVTQPCKNKILTLRDSESDVSQKTQEDELKMINVFLRNSEKVTIRVNTKSDNKKTAIKSAKEIKTTNPPRKQKKKREAKARLKITLKIKKNEESKVSL